MRPLRRATGPIGLGQPRSRSAATPRTPIRRTSERSRSSTCGRRSKAPAVSRRPQILEYLVSKDEGPWAKWWESAIARGEFKSPAARLARLLRPFGIKPEQVWIDGKNVRGYDADAFRTEAVAVYLRSDARDANDARGGSSSQALSSDPSEARELSAVAPESIPLIGDEGYLEHLYAPLEAGSSPNLSGMRGIAHTACSGRCGGDASPHDSAAAQAKVRVLRS